MNLKDKTLILSGELTRFSVPQLFKELKKLPKSEIREIDLDNVNKIDSAGVAFLDELMQSSKTLSPEITRANESVLKAINTFSSLKIPNSSPRQEPGFFERMGTALINFKTETVQGLFLTSDIIFWSVVAVFNRKSQKKGVITQQCLLIGADAVGIISLLSLILGLILALQSAAQLRQFGANIFVADLIAISMVREMGPMMTAIIVAGRSGSAIASEIATMQVAEEIDALKVMAINPLRYIVAPKFNAMTICMPLLVIISIVVGVIGGLLVGIFYLDLTIMAYFTELFSVLTTKDLIVGLSKSLFFAWVIVIIGAYYGFNVTGGSEGVGKATTRSVVASIFAVIVLDAIFSLIYML